MQPVHLGLLIVGREVEVDAVLHDLVVGHREEQPVRARSGRRAARRRRRRRSRRASRAPRPTTRASASTSRGVDADLVEPQTHVIPCISSFFSTLPIALRGRLVDDAHLARPLVHRKLFGDEVDQRLRARPSPTTNATIRWPRSSSGTPTTATSTTPACPSSTVSISPAPIAVAAGLDQVDRLAADDAVHAAGVDHRDVAGAVPAVGAEHLGGGLGTVQVAVEQRGPSNLKAPNGFPVVRHLAHRPRRPAGSARRPAAGPPSRAVARRRPGCSA